VNYFSQPGNVLTLTAPYACASGAGAKVGAIFGVATAAVLISEEGEFATVGVYSLAKTSAQAWAVGERIYWDDTNKRCDTDSAVGMLIGAATAIAANPSSTGYVRLNGGAVPEGAEGAQAAITSLTDNTAGTANNVLQALADGTTYATDVAAIRNNFADIGAKVNEILAAMRTAGIIDT
jgi:predicted RecA/RadA family phage recombinase